MKISEILEAKKEVAKWVVRSTNKTPKDLLGKNYIAKTEQEAIEWNEKNGFNGEITPEDKFGVKINRRSISVNEGLTFKSEKLVINVEVSKDGKDSIQRFIFNSEDLDKTDAIAKAKKYFEDKGFKVKSAAQGGKAKPSESLTESETKLEEASLDSVCSRLSKQLKPILNDLGQYADDDGPAKFRKAINMAWDDIKSAIDYLEFKK